MNKRKLTESIKGLPFNPRDRKTFLQEITKGNGVEIVDSVDKLNPNAPEGSIASVVTENKVLIDVSNVPFAEEDSDGIPIFSENLVKVDDIDIEIIKYLFSEEGVFITFYDFNTKYLLWCIAGNDGIGYCKAKNYDIDNKMIYYYDNVTQTINHKVIDDLKNIFKNGDYYIIWHCNVEMEGHIQEEIEVLHNTFQLYSGTDFKVELYKKEGDWKPIINNENNSENADDNNIPEFTLKFGAFGRGEILSGSTYKFVGYELMYDYIEESKVNFVEGKAKIKIYLETDLFRTVDPIVAEVTIGDKFGAMSSNFVKIDTNFNKIKVLYYDDSYTDYISGTLASKYSSINLKYFYYLTISNEDDILIDSSINTEDKIKTLLGITGVNTRPCKMILPTFNSYGGCVVPGVIDAEDINNVYINVIYKSNIRKYKVNTDSISFVEQIITSDISLNVNIDNDSLDATVGQSLYGRLDSSNIKNLYFTLNGATYSVNSVVPSGETNKWYVSFGSDIVYKYLIYCYPATANPITYKAKILERNSFDLNQLVNA